MTHRTRTVNGVRHGARCACPVCDPDDRLLKQVRSQGRAPAQSAAAAPIAAARWAARSRTPAVPNQDAGATRRLRQLLQEGKTFAEADAIIEAERTEGTHG